MATLHVKDIPDELYDAVKRRAALQGRSLAEEVRRILQEAAGGHERSMAAILGSIERLRRNQAKRQAVPPIEQMIREDRDR